MHAGSATGTGRQAKRYFMHPLFASHGLVLDELASVVGDTGRRDLWQTLDTANVGTERLVKAKEALGEELVEAARPWLKAFDDEDDE